MAEDARRVSDLAGVMLEGPRLFTSRWLAAPGRIAVPMVTAAPAAPATAGRIAAAAHAEGATEVLICGTGEDRLADPVHTVMADGADILAELRTLGAADTLIALPDLSAAVLVTTGQFGVVAGGRQFVESVLGTDLAGARSAFAELALVRRTQTPRLLEVAAFYGCALSQRAWRAAYTGWSALAEVPAESAVAAQVAAVRSLAAGEVEPDVFIVRFLAARRAEIEGGERTVGSLGKALDAVFWAIDAYVPAEFGGPRLPGELDEGGLVSAVRMELRDL